MERPTLPNKLENWFATHPLTSIYLLVITMVEFILYVAAK